MPPKSKKKQEKESKKAAQKKKEKIIEDKTFGLKNKNKSKVVQNKIRSIEKNVLNSGDPKQRKLDEQRKKAKADAKARKKALEEERNALFGEALMAVQKKNKAGGANQKDGRVEAKGRDGNDADAKKGTSRAMKMMFQMDAKEMADKLREDPNYVPTLEDEIESKRQQKVEELKRSGKKGTPVTEESFRLWQERKRKRKAEEAKKLVEAELKKKKGGKGLAVLSGRALYEYKRDLFVDDEDVEKRKEEEEKNENGGENKTNDQEVAQVAAKVQENLFLDGDDDDLDDLDDDDGE
mmetsp:Transcript_8794/g.20337  ORF Transcript_8794/g.20337 Transcript_8794/m.20337 type:complete len:294 (-) Transcript_8794:111-992(-)|eukprot:CAMPEP_0116837176 /NCGR_PEP_ID=MMETSP0418-20121206/8507_1 /TAXON_ID=1158023 /ORGANISM="Astrosyne radiata, Strain 13vi08-1A" /LENGTH=293 /DNA_ID=CAMNT_0004467029 /DNA_START=112 /DNA_END=993 /DNA_ORIENTATION=+